MTNKFYAPGEQRAARVKDLFDTIAVRYDLINDLQSFGLHRHWKRRLVRLAANAKADANAHAAPPSKACNTSADSPPPTQPLFALDLCCGTGDVAFALTQLGLSVVGLDFSEPMLAVAAQRLSALTAQRQTSGAPFPAARFLRGDAQHIPFPDATFDLVTISYGLRNLADLEAGLREMFRVLRPGGRVLILDFGKPDHPLWRAIYFGYLKNFVPLLGRWFCGDPDTHGYILESLKGYAAQRGVAARMRELGFQDAGILNLMGGIMSINFGRRPA